MIADCRYAKVLEVGYGAGAVLRLSRAVYELSYETAEFDLVLSFSVFEHLHRYEHALSEVGRVLKPGGRFLLGIPAVNAMMELGFRIIGFKGIEDLHVTTTQAAASAFDRAGFRAVCHARLRLIPGLAIYFNWLWKRPRDARVALPS